MARFAGGTYRGPVALLVVFLISSGALLSVGLTPAAAGVTTVTGGAFNYSTDVGLFGGEPLRRGHGQPPDAPAAAASPAVQCPPGGGRSSVTDPDGARAVYGPATLFGGIWPESNHAAPPSGPLTSSIDCKLGEGGHVTASTSLTLMPEGSTWLTPGQRAEHHPGGVGPGPFIAEEVHSTCTMSADGATSDVTIVNGTLETKYDPHTGQAVQIERIAQNPPPNYTREGTTDVGDRYRITLNEQVANPDGSLTVNAVRMQLLGGAALGEVVVGQSRCGIKATAAPPVAATAAPPNTAARPAPSTLAAAPSTTPDAEPPPSAAGAPPTTPGPVRSAATSPSGERSTAPFTVAQAPAGMSALAFNFSVDVGLFGGPSMRRGYNQYEEAELRGQEAPPEFSESPTVECPAGGGTDSETKPEGARAVYGPATIFGGVWPWPDSPTAPPSGPLTASVDCGPDEVTASTLVTQMPPGSTWSPPDDYPHPGGIGPGPLLADEVESTCTMTADGTVTSNVRFDNGIVETSYDPDTQEPATTEPIPDSPAPGHQISGQIDHVGDSFEITFNVQTQNDDGSFTVVAARMELLGPTAVGEMVIGSATCGGTGAAAPAPTPGPGTTPGTTPETGTPGTGTTGTGTNGQVARTGTDPRPAAALGLGLMLLGTIALQGGAHGRARARP